MRWSYWRSWGQYHSILTPHSNSLTQSHGSLTCGGERQKALAVLWLADLVQNSDWEEVARLFLQYFYAVTLRTGICSGCLPYAGSDDDLDFFDGPSLLLWRSVVGVAGICLARAQGCCECAVSVSSFDGGVNWNTQFRIQSCLNALDVR